VRTQRQVSTELHWPYEGSTTGMVVHWHFTTSQLSVKNDGGQYVTNIGVGEPHDILLTSTGVGIVAGSPSHNPNYPCGNVYKNIWYFTAPESYLGDIRKAYNGRLQFKLLASSSSGSPRHARGSIEIESSDGTLLSNSLKYFALPNNSSWTSYSTTLSEKAGWKVEPAGTTATFSEMRKVLKSVQSIRIRGDAYVYSGVGYGQETVYINDVELYKANK